MAQAVFVKSILWNKSYKARYRSSQKNTTKHLYSSVIHMFMLAHQTQTSCYSNYPQKQTTQTPTRFAPAQSPRPGSRRANAAVGHLHGRHRDTTGGARGRRLEKLEQGLGACGSVVSRQDEAAEEWGGTIGHHSVGTPVDPQGSVLNRSTGEAGFRTARSFSLGVRSKKLDSLSQCP